MNLVTLLIVLLIISCYYLKRQQRPSVYRIKPKEKTNVLSEAYPNAVKPPWVISEVIRLKAILGKQAGCRRVAQTFNRLHGQRETVGKTFVAEIIRKHQYQIIKERQKIKNKLPYQVAINVTWAMDLSFYTTTNNIIQPFIAILDHGSRKLLSLNTIINKSSWALLGYLCLAISKYGKPQKLRTDNEIIFTGFVFRTFLKLVNIQQQKIPTASPWCNGRIERLFGTLKPMLKLFVIQDKRALQSWLSHFRNWYNYKRTHQNLNGKTPEDIWRQRRRK